MPIKTLLIIKTGNTYPHIAQQVGGDFEDWIYNPLSSQSKQQLQLQTIEVHKGAALPPIDQAKSSLSGIIITGSAAMVTDQLPWMVQTSDWLLKLFSKTPIPTLGICFGHQLLAHTLGGKVGYHPLGREMGSRTVQRLPSSDKDPLFEKVPTYFDAHLSHLQSVLQLPPEVTHLATGDFEPHQAYRYREHVWGVQFHPEFTEVSMKAYIDELTPTMKREGLNITDIHNSVTATPEPAHILENFAKVSISS